MATTTDVPGLYDVGLDGIGFLLDDTSDGPAIQHQSLTTQKEQAGSNANIGEQTVNPEGFWRRSRDGWHHGAGQTYADRDESDPLRFRISRGVDVFSAPHQVTLLKSMDLAYTLTNGFSSIGIYNAAGTLYFVENSSATLQFVTSATPPWTPTTVTGGPATFTSVCSIGTTVFIGTDSGVYSSAVGSGTMSSYTSGGGTLRVWAAKGRLMVADGSTLYNVTASGALPTALTTFPTGLRVVGVTGSSNWIYIAVAGANARSLIYKTTIKPDGTALDVPSVAGELPEDDTLATSGNPIFGYLGFLFIHSDRGVRMASIDADGNLTFGSIISSENANFAAWMAEGRFVWFNYDVPAPLSVPATGRMDLSVTTLPLTPAYAPDLETPDNDTYRVMTLASLNGRRIVGTEAHIYVESSDYLDSGYIDSGLLALDLADPKTPVSIDVEGGGLDDDHTITEALSVDRGASFTTVGTWDDQADGDTAISGIGPARQFELRTTLTSDGSGTPTLYRHTLRVEPNVNQGNYIIVRLRLFENQIGFGGQHTSLASPADALAQLESWQQSRAVIVFQEGSVNYNVTLRDLQSVTESPCQAPFDGDWNRTAVARLKVIGVAA